MGAGSKDLRCGWCGEDPLYIRYHDEEWGVPERDDQALFERLVLEGMQAGLSWLTVLRKREHMRKAFLGFDFRALAKGDSALVECWLQDPGLIRNRAKLSAVLANARAAVALPESLAGLVWSVVDGAPVQNRWRRLEEVPSETAASRTLARALKDRGFRFVGPVTCYAFMQSAGLVNDHLLGCPAHSRCAALNHPNAAQVAE